MSGPSSPRRSNDPDLSNIGKQTQQTQSDSLVDGHAHVDTQRVKHVQKEWEHRNFYIPEELDDALESVRAEMADSISGEFGGQMAVTRHFYPVMIQLGLARIKDLSPAEFAEQVETIPGVAADEFSE